MATEHAKILLFEDAELRSTYSIEELTRSEEPDMEDEAGVEAREVGALIAYSGGFIASYGQDAVFVFEQTASGGEEFNFKCIKRIKFPKVNIYFKHQCTIKRPQDETRIYLNIIIYIQILNDRFPHLENH